MKEEERKKFFNDKKLLLGHFIGQVDPDGGPG